MLAPETARTGEITRILLARVWFREPITWPTPPDTLLLPPTVMLTGIRGAAAD
jgi:hypothetical protein